MRKWTAEETLKNMIRNLTENLMELEECLEKTAFAYGEKTAYVECLEWIQRWQSATENGLNYEIEERFPL